jgi:hypothetical protein
MNKNRFIKFLLALVVLQSCQKNLNDSFNIPPEQNLAKAGSQTGRTANQSPYYWSNRSVQEVLPQNNTYVHGVGSLTWAGVNNATTSTCSTDCSGFLNHIYTQTYNYSSADYQSWLGASRPIALNYYNAIQAQNHFTKISKLSSMIQGDIIAIKYPADNTNSGHIMTIVSPPVLRTATAPVVSGTTQYEVTIIDCSSSGHGPTDTRYISSGNWVQGVGKGVFRFYLNKKGAISGYSWSTYSSSVYYTQAERPLLVGRHQPLP